MNARHSMTSAEWYTPSLYVDAARATMGTIDVDPASCAGANEIVRARQYYTEAEDGLMQPWHGNVFLNPPGGKRDGVSLAVLFWKRLLQHWTRGEIEQAIWIGYSLEQLQTFQSAGRPYWTPIEYPICIPKRRIAFVGRGTSPSHGNYITYLGSRVDEFRAAFAPLGVVR